MSDKKLFRNTQDLFSMLDFYTQQLRWEIFPIKPYSKSPPLCLWQSEASRDSLQIREWWGRNPNANIGLRCGVTSGVVVVDVDPLHTGDESLLELFSEYDNFPDTPVCMTGGGGQHFFFKHPIDVKIPSKNGVLAPGIDIKADGGYVLLSPSIHPSGERYLWDEVVAPSKLEMAELPTWLFDLIRDKPESRTSKKIVLPLDENEPFVSGTRNEILTSLAGTMRKRGMSEGAILSALITENDKKCIPPLPRDEVEKIAESVSRYKPDAVPKASSMSVSSRRSQLEWLFIACAYSDIDSAIRIAGWVNETSIANKVLRQFWSRVKMGEDKVEVANDLGILADIGAWRRHVPNVSELDLLAHQVARNSYVDNVAGKLVNLSTAVTSADVDEIKRIVVSMGEDTPSTGRVAKSAKEGLAEFREMLEHIGDRAIPSYLVPVDEILGGFEKQTLTIIGARPGAGKTTIAWQIARQMAASGHVVMFHSLEMSARSLWAKASSGVAELRWRNVRGGNCTPDEIKTLKEVSVKLEGMFGDTILVDDAPATTDVVWQMASQNKPDVVIIDHLRLLKDHFSSMKEHQRLGYISQRLKDLAKFFEIPVICLAQLNRQVEGRDNKRPQMSDLRDSGQIEENADNILMLFPKDYYEVMEQSGQDSSHLIEPEYYETEVLFRKIRDDRFGQRTTIYFHGAQQWFYRFEDTQKYTGNREEF